MADLRTLALCAGVGGLELGVHEATGGRSRVVGYVERDAYAAAVLMARMEDSSLEPAPVWCGDLAGLPLGTFAGRVDLITAGFPCQPFSVAGKQKGTDDERWIWGDIERIIRDVGPRWVFLENVRGLLAGDGFGAVLGSLADLGFDAEWEVFRASDVGAPHRRERVFILAHLWRQRLEGDGHQGAAARTTGRGSGAEVVGRWPPGPNDRTAWAAVLDQRPDLAPALPNPTNRQEGAAGMLSTTRGPTSGATSQSTVCGVADGLPDWMEFRTDRLRCLGNAVVPQQAALAFATLMEGATDAD